MKTIALLCASLIFLSGCGHMIIEQRKKDINSYLSGNNDINPQIARAMRNLNIATGMTKGQVRMVWGLPRRVNVYSSGNRQQWIYNEICQYGPIIQPNWYLYFEGNHLTNWQHLGCS